MTEGRTSMTATALRSLLEQHYAAPGPLVCRRAWFDACPDIAGMAVQAK